VLLLSERYQWFPFNEHKGWTVLIGVAMLCVALLLLTIWFAAGLVFRQRFQFSLRSLLVLVVAVAVPCSWLAVRMQQAKRQREVVEAIWAAKGHVRYDRSYHRADRAAEFPGPTWLLAIFGHDFFADVEHTFTEFRDGAAGITDEGLEHLSELTNLESLSLVDTQVTEESLAHLENLTRLEFLELSGPNVTDAGMDHLKGLANLEVLLLDDTKVGDAGLEQLRELHNLRVLGLWNTEVSDAGLRHLAALTSLETLRLGKNRVSSVGIKHLTDLARLQKLNLSDTLVDDTGLKHVSALLNLYELDLRRTQITDAGLEHLKGLRNLQDLDLQGTKISDSGLENFKNLPILRHLSLADTDVRGPGLRHLRGLPELECLMLHGTELSEGGLESLRDLPNLRELYLDNTNVTDADLEYLESLSNLESLDLRDTEVTDEDADRLKRALPGCRIHWDWQFDDDAQGPTVATEDLPPKDEVPDFPTDNTFTNSVGMKFARLPAGEFLMGSPKDEADRDDDEVQHRVRITKPFYLGVYEVTQVEYVRVMGKNPAHIVGLTRPVEMVRWDDAVAFCERLSKMEGRTYRLPTEAEWEYACRAGTTTPFAFGETLSSKTDANIDGEYPYGEGEKGPNLETSTPVGLYPPNASGLYDMHGNVNEWCEDRYGKNYYKVSPANDPIGPVSGQFRVIRGGSWYEWASYARSAERSGDLPGFYASWCGFRVALVPNE